MEDSLQLLFHLQSHCSLSPIQVLVDSCSDLKSVDLSNNYWLDGEQLVLLLEKHSNLTELVLSGCNNESLHRKFVNFSKCDNLTTIMLEKCHWIDERVLTWLARCEKLRKVILADCSQITGSSIILFCKLCRGYESSIFETEKLCFRLHTHIQ